MSIEESSDRTVSAPRAARRAAAADTFDSAEPYVPARRARRAALPDLDDIAAPIVASRRALIEPAVDTTTTPALQVPDDVVAVAQLPHAEGRRTRRPRVGRPSATQPGKTGKTRRPTALLAVLAMAVAGLSGTGLLVGTSPSVATEPGHPGVPQPGTVVYTEDFQNATTPELLTSYVSSTGVTYTADPFWVSWANASGVILNSTQPKASSLVLDSGWSAMQNLALGLGQAQGQGADAVNNYALTWVNPGDAVGNGYLIKMSSSLPAVPGHFYAVSALIATVYCQSNHPSLTFSLVVDGHETPLATGLDPCTAAGRVQYGSDPGGGPVYVVRLQSPAIQVTTDSTLGFNLYDAQTSGNGNDEGLDLPSIVDVTPQLDVSFSPELVNGTTPSEITYTITNTDDLLAKNGWSFQSTIPTGLQLAPDSSPSTTCSGANISLDGSNLSVMGNIAANTPFCTVTVPVMSDTQAGQTNTYDFTPSNITGLYAVAAPAEAALTVDAQPPDPPVITAPTDGLVTPITKPDITGTAEPDSHVVVTRDDNTTICTATADEDGNWSCTPANDLDDGTYNITATATDAVGNQSDASPQTSFTVDTGAPDPPIITWPTNNGKASAHPPIRGTGEPGATVTVTVPAPVDAEDQTPVTICTGTVDSNGAWTCTPSTALADGPHTITAQQTDAAMNSSENSASVTFTVDGDVPNPPAITAPTPNTLTSSNQPTVQGTGESGAHVVVTTSTGATFCEGDVAADGTWWCTPTTAQADGAYTVTAKQTDDVGNESDASAPTNFTIDATKPDKPVVTSPAANSITNQVRPPITGTGEAGAHLVVTQGATTVCQTDVAANGSWSCTPTADLPQGANTITVMQTDAAQLSSDPVTVQFTVDSIKPAVPTISTPAMGTWVDTTTPPITGTAEPGAHVIVNEGTTKVCEADASTTGAWTCTPTTALSQGGHSITATQTDKAGNRSDASAPTSFSVDSNRPLAPAFTAPTNGSSTNNPSPSITGTGEPGTHVVVLENDNVVCGSDVDGNGVWACTPTTALHDGTHTLTATQTDDAGNESPAATVQFRIDTNRPAAPNILGPATGVTIAQNTPTISGTGEPGANLVITENSNTVCTTTVGDDGSWTCPLTTNLPDGAHTLTATQTDAAGNESPSNPVSFTVDTTPPAAPAILGPTAGSTIAQNAPAINGTGEPGANVVVSEGDLTICRAVVATDGTWTCNATVALPNGSNTLTARQSDPVGNQSEPGSTTFTVQANPPQPPAITSPTTGSMTSDATPPITGTGLAGAHVRVTEGDSLVCETDVDATGAWTCTPEYELADGAHTVSATQTDAAGNMSRATAVSFRIDSSVPAPPHITAPAAGGVTGDPTPVVSGTGEPGDHITVVEGGTVLCETDVLTDGTWSCDSTVTLPDGSHSISVMQTNPNGTPSEAATRQFTVDTTPPELTLDPSDGTSISGTTDPNTQVDITDADGNPIAGCEDVTSDAQGRFSCTPTNPLPDGAIHAAAMDAAGNASHDSGQSVRVRSIAMDPVTGVASGATPTLTGTGQPGYTVSVVDGGTVLCQATVQADGTWSCTSTVKLGGGDHDVTAVQTDPSGNASAPVQQTVSVTPNRVAINPVTDVTSGARPVLSGTGEPGYHVTVSDSSGTLCEADVQADGTWSCTSSTKVVAGDYSLTATQTDPAGKATAPAQTSLSVPATQVGLNPIDTTAGTHPVVSGVGEPGYSVTVMDGTTKVCSTTVGADGTWSCQAEQPFGDGDHTLTVVQTGPDGNPTAPATAQFSVPTEPTPPTPAPAQAQVVTYTAPAGGSILGNSTDWALVGLTALVGLVVLVVVMKRRPVPVVPDQ